MGLSRRVRQPSRNGGSPVSAWASDDTAAELPGDEGTEQDPEDEELPVPLPWLEPARAAAMRLPRISPVREGL